MPKVKHKSQDNTQSKRKEEAIEWIPPSKSCSTRWVGFLMAKERDHSAGRRRAKCTYCNNVLYGKPQFLKKHMVNECQSIPGDKKSEYINAVTPQESDKSEIESTPNTKLAPLVPKIIHNYTQSTFNHFVQRKKDKMDEIYKDLCLALIIGRVPVALLENKYFVQFQRQLSVSPITPTSRYVMMNRILPTVHAECVRDMQKDLASQSGVTISLDGWSDIFHNSFYAVLAL